VPGKKSILLAGIVCALAIGAAADNPPHKTGRFSVSFDKRSPLSGPDVQERRKLTDSGKYDKPAQYTLSDLTFEVLVPDSYSPQKPAPLFVWINSGDGGGPPGQLVPALQKRGMLFVGANGTGNDHPEVKRIGAAVDAAFNMSALYAIDTNRVYISGSSGGGRCASRAALAFSDVFTGGAFYVIGCDSYDDIPVGDGSNRMYPGFWTSRDKKLFNAAKSHWFVFLTGSKDFNRPGTLGAHKAYTSDGFDHCAYLEVPDMGHQNPPDEYFEQGLAFLDGILQERGEKALAQALKLVQLKKPAEAAPLFAQAADDGIEEAAAHLDALKAATDRDTDPGLKLFEAGKPAPARVHFQKVIRTYGGRLAARAQEELAKIEASPAFTNERTAAERFQQFRARFKTDGRDKTEAALKRMAEAFPDTEATKQAEDVLANMGAKP
jgi:hypothetical protein